MVTIVGLAVVIGVIWFGRMIFRMQMGWRFFDHPYLEELFMRYFKGPPPHDDVPRCVSEMYTEYLQRRNEFWTSYGQVLIAVLIVIVLSILLLAKAISAEAGLPILSGISGFAIAKGVSGAKTVNMPQFRERG